MIFAPRKKIIASRFRQRGNIVSQFPPAPVVPVVPIDLWVQIDFQINPESISGGLRLDVIFSPDGTRALTTRDSSNRIDAYDIVPPFAIAPGTWLNRTADTINDPRWLWWKPDGLRLYQGTGGGTFFQKDAAIPFDITALVGAGSKFLGNRLDAYMSADGFTLWLLETQQNRINEHAMTVAFDITTLVSAPTQFFDMTADLGGPTAPNSFTFSDDGTLLYIIANVGSPGTLAQWSLTSAFDISTMGSFILGISIGDPARMSIPRALNYRPTDGFLYVFGDQGSGNQRVKIFGPPQPPPPPPQANASEYFLNQVSNANPGVGGGTRLDVFWKQDGTKVWTGRQNAEIRQFDVSPPWGIDSGDWTLDFTTANVGNFRSLWWSPDGTVFAHCQRVPSTSMRVTTFDQSATPFDLTVLGASTTNAWTPTGGVTPQDIIFSPDGKRLWVQGPIGVTSPILEFALTVGYDMTTLNTVQVKTFTPVGTNTLGFSEDGTKLYTMLGSVLNSFDMSIPFDIDTLSNLLAGPSVLAGDVQIPRGLTFREDNEDIFIAGDQNARKCAFFRKSTAPKIDEFSFDSEADLSGGNRLSLNGIFITDDGLHLYCCRSSAVVNDAFWFEMSSAHDLSTISFTKENNADGQNPRGIFVRQDGSQLFILFRNPTNPDGIFRWTPLSTPFDITTKGVRTTLTVEPPGSNNPSGLHFKPDGFKVYITDITANVVLEFTLGTAFDMTTGSHTGTFDTSGEVLSISDLTMDSTGTKMYVLDRSNNEVEQFNLSIPFDIDSAGASGVTALVVEQGTGTDPTGIHLTDNDTKLYVVYDDSPIVELYTIP